MYVRISLVAAWFCISWGGGVGDYAGGGAVRIHQHCGFNPMNPAAVFSPTAVASPVVWCLGVCVWLGVWSLLARAAVYRLVSCCRAILTGEAGASCLYHTVGPVRSCYNPYKSFTTIRDAPKHTTTVRNSTTDMNNCRLRSPRRHSCLT